MAEFNLGTTVYKDADAQVDEVAFGAPAAPQSHWEDLASRLESEVAEERAAEERATTGPPPEQEEPGLPGVYGLPEGMQPEEGLQTDWGPGPTGLASEVLDELGVTKFMVDALSFAGRRFGSLGAGIMAAAADPSHAESFIGRAGENLATAGKAFAREWASKWGESRTGEDAMKVIQKSFPELGPKSQQAAAMGLETIVDPANIALFYGPLRSMITRAAGRSTATGTAMTGKTFQEGVAHLQASLPPGVKLRGNRAMQLAGYADAGSKTAASKLHKLIKTDVGPAILNYERKLMAKDVRALSNYDALITRADGTAVVSATGKPKIVRRPVPNVFLQEADKLTKQRATGSITRAAKDLNGHIKTRPFEFRSSYLDINSPADVDALAGRYIKEATDMMSQVGPKVKGPKSKQLLSDMLGKQKDMLAQEIGDEVLIKLAPEEALGYRILLRDLGAGIKQCIRDIPPGSGSVEEVASMQFSANQDFMRFWKLIIARESVRSTLALKKVDAVKAFARVNTKAPADSPGIRLMMFSRAKDSLPKPSSKASVMLAGHLSRLDKPEMVNKYLNKLFSPGGMKLLERRKNWDVKAWHMKAEEFMHGVYMDAALSRPVTHIKNFSDTGVNLFYQDIKEITSAVPALARLDGTAALDHLQIGMARIHGHLESIGDLLTATAKNNPKRAMNMDMFTGMHEVAQLRNTGALSPEALRHVSPIKKVAAWLENKRPAQMLGKADANLKYIEARSSHRALAMAKAKSLTKNREMQRTLYDYFVDSPMEQMKVQAYTNAEKYTYQQAWNPNSLIERKVLSQLTQIPYLRFITLFVRTPHRIAQRFMADGPLTVLAPSTISGLRQGGMAFDRAAAKVMLASGTAGYLIMNTSEETLTGSVPYQYQAEIPPYTVRIPGMDQGLNYGALGPIRWTLGSAANLRNLIQYTDWDSLDGPETAKKAVGGVTLAFAEAMADSFFLERLANVTAGVRDLESSGPDMLIREFQSMALTLAAPGATRTIKELYDAKIRETNSFMDKFVAVTPGLSQDLPKRVDIFGNELRKPTTSLVLPVYLSKMDASPAAQELRKYDVRIGDVPSDYNGLVKLTTLQKAKLRHLRAFGDGTKSMPPLRETIDKYILDDRYKDFLPEEKKAILQGIISGYNQAALAILYREDDDGIQEKARDAQVEIEERREQQEVEQ